MIGAVQQMISIIAILLLLLLFLLIGIHDYVGTYEETIICMLGAMNHVLFNGNHMNDNNTTIPSSSLTVVAVTVAIALPWVWCVYSTYSIRVRQITYACRVRRIMFVY